MKTITIIEATIYSEECRVKIEEIEAKENAKTYSLLSASKILYKKLVYKSELEKLNTNSWRASLISIKPREEVIKDWEILMTKYTSEQQLRLDKLKENIKLKE